MPRSNARGRADGILRTVGDGTVVAADIGTGVITDAKIATGAVTNAKLVPSARAGAQGRVNLTFDSAQTLDLSQGNFFDADSTSGTNTTLSFANVPTTAKWNYKVKHSLGEQVDSVSTASDLSTWTYSSNSQHTPTVVGSGSYLAAFIGDNGNKFYAIQFGYPGSIYQFNLSTPYDISTGTSISKQITLGEASNANPRGFAFDDTGTKLFVAQASTANPLIKGYTLSTPWDVSTRSFTSSLDLPNPSGEQGWDLDFSYDGKTLYLLDHTVSIVKQYSLSTAWDPSTATYTSKSYEFKRQTYGVALNRDGTILYSSSQPNPSIGYTSSLFQVDLTTAGDVSTADSSTTATRSVNDFIGSWNPNIYNLQLTRENGYAVISGYTQTPNFAVATTPVVAGSDITTSFSSTTLPVAVKNTLSSTPDSDNPHQIIEFITSDSGTNVYITNDFVSPASLPAGPDYTISVTNSGLAYILTGTDRNGNVSGIHPTLAFNNGDKVQFNVDAGTSSSHPFYIKTAQVTGTGSQAPGAVGGGTTQIDWTIGSTGTFYYQCSIHSVMNNTITVS